MYIPTAEIKTEPHSGRPMFPIITICGSTRFKDELIAVVGELTHAGWCVLPVGVTDESRVIDVDKKNMLNELHAQKIRMSQAIYVVNKGGYIGKSTAHEIAYAISVGCKVYHMEGDCDVCRDS